MASTAFDDERQCAGSGNDGSKLLEENSQLRAQITKLQRENASLAEQFSQTSTICDQLSAMHKQNSDLKKQLTSSQSEISDLSQRLEISLQMHNEASQKSQQEAELANSMAKNEITELNKAIQSIQNESQSKQSALQAQINDCKSEEQIAKCTLESSLASISGMLEAARKRFGKAFSDPSEFIQWASQANVSFSQSESISEKGARSMEGADSLSKLHEKLKKEKKQRKIAEAELKRYASEEESIKSGLEAKISAMEADLQKQHILNQQIQADFETKMRQKESDLSSILASKDSASVNQKKLIEELQQKHSEDTSSLQKSIDSLQSQLSQTNASFKAASASLSQLKLQNTQLIAQAGESEAIRQSLKKSISSLRSDLGDSKSELSKAESELHLSSIERDKLQEQLNGCLSQLHAAKLSFKQSKASIVEAEGRAEQSKNAISILEKQMNDQQKEIALLYSGREKYLSLIRLQASALNQMDSKMKDLQNVEKVQYIQPKPVEIEKIPSNVWAEPDFPKELCYNISKIVSIEDLPLSSKIRQVIKEISRHYNESIAEQKKIQIGMEKEVEIREGILKQIAETVSPLSDYPIPTTDLAKSPEPIINALKVLIPQKEEVASTASEMDSVCDALGIERKSGAVNAIEELKDSISQVGTEREALMYKLKKYRRGIKMIRDGYNHQIESLQTELSQKSSEICDLQKTLDDLTSKSSSLQLSSDAQKEEIDQLKLSHSQDLTKQRSEMDEEIATIKRSSSKDVLKAQSQINEIRQKLQEVEMKNGVLENEISERKTEADRLRSERSAVEKSHSELAEKAEESEAALRGQFEKEKEAIKVQYSNLVEGLKAKTSEQRELIAKLSASLEEAEERAKELIEENTKLGVEKQQSDAISQALQDERDRERRLSETRMKAVQITCDMKLQQELENQQTANEAERRRMYGYIATTFRRFVDVKRRIDDNYIREIVANAQSEADKLSKSIKSIQKLMASHGDESIAKTIDEIINQSK